MDSRLTCLPTGSGSQITFLRAISDELKSLIANRDHSIELEFVFCIRSNLRHPGVISSQSPCS